MLYIVIKKLFINLKNKCENAWIYEEFLLTSWHTKHVYYNK